VRTQNTHITGVGEGICTGIVAGCAFADPVCSGKYALLGGSTLSAQLTAYEVFAHESAVIAASWNRAPKAGALGAVAI
jgi:hypothetical protein